MRVAVLSTSSWRTPPVHYGAWELFASTLTEGLVKKGVDVTLFATKDSITKAKLEAIVPKGTQDDKYHGNGEIFKDSDIWQSLHIAHCMGQADKFDIVHSNLNYSPLFYTPLIKTPVVTTVHSGTIEFERSEINLEVYKKYNDINYYVSISNAARHPSLKYAKTIYHGMDLSESTFVPKKGKYLLTLGRIHSDKGVAEAINLAKKFGMKLVIAGIIHDEEYFHKQIKPHVDNENVEYLGPVGGRDKDRVLGDAHALLHLINFEEPFGLSVIEAMAVGTPVVAMNKGAMAEIIDDGKTGFLISNLDEALESLKKVENIDRLNCRKVVEERFSADVMVENYLDLYKKILLEKSN